MWRELDCKFILAREKYNQLKLLFRYTEVRIGCFAGGNKPRGGVEAYDVLICTIEKANFILNYLKTEDKLGIRFKCADPLNSMSISKGPKKYLCEFAGPLLRN